MRYSDEQSQEAEAEADRRRQSAYAGAARRPAEARPRLDRAPPGTAIAATPAPRSRSTTPSYVLVTLGLAAGALAFLDAIYRKGSKASIPAFKKFLGYGLVLHYAAAALPRVDWASAGLIGHGRVTYMFVLAMLCLASGIVLFVACGQARRLRRPRPHRRRGGEGQALRKKRFAERRKKGFLHGALEWVDALGFAAILVILIQTFVFQLYEIPSESMVPAFLIKDRPFTAKLDAGPACP